MRAMALLAAYNEERVIGACLEHLIRQGMEVYLIDNASTDRTVAIARGYLSRGLTGIETVPRHGTYSWRPLLERKEGLARALDADWFMHVDADEFRLPPPGNASLVEALAMVDAAGFNAVTFDEFVFTPTREHPDHDHAQFQQTMRWYYAFLPAAQPHRLNAWKRQDERVELAWSGGHQVRFAGLRPYPRAFAMRHYLFLSLEHAAAKYVDRRYDEAEVREGWHRARAALRPDEIVLPGESELRPYVSDALLDNADPRRSHLVFSRHSDPAKEGLVCPAPVVIGALGGSGTRVVARLARRAGVYMGTHRNESEDAMEFVAFYDQWINRFMRRQTAPFSVDEVAAMTAAFDGCVARHRADGLGATRWGWKEPRSLYLLPFFHGCWPDLRFIHVVRDGRDMAFSSNQNQLRKHGDAVLDVRFAALAGPIKTAGLWNQINMATADYGETALGDRYLRVRFEDLCLRPDEVAAKIFAFLGVDGALAAAAAADIGRPATIGRWQAAADPDLLAAIYHHAQPALRRFAYVQ
jgi:hypothetical protein